MLATLREWQQNVVPPEAMIVQASTMDGRDGQTASPIGMGYQYVYEKGNEALLQVGNHTNLLLCAITVGTDSRRRRSANVNRAKIVETLEKNGFANQTLEAPDYFRALPTHKFVVSPEGNGVDAHRHYEALMAGCIPIIEVNPIIKAKYGNAPILWTHDYSEINEAYLQDKYEKMLDKVWDFSHLFLQHWSPCEQYIIRERGNYWCERLTGKRWY